MSHKFNDVYKIVIEKDEHKKSKEYKKLSPKMKDAIDSIFKKMDDKPSDFLNSFEKSIKHILIFHSSVTISRSQINYLHST